MNEDIQDLKKLGILVDKDQDGYMLQIFTNHYKIDPHCFLKLFRERDHRVLER